MPAFAGMTMLSFASSPCAVRDAAMAVKSFGETLQRGTWRIGDCRAGRACHSWGMGKPALQISPVRSAADLEATIMLFRAYAASLDIDLAYQDFAGEMAAMPGKYAPPNGELLLARDAAGAALGCVGLRPLDIAGCCEMKRLYVCPAGRGSGVAKGLIDALLAVAGRIGIARCGWTRCPRWQRHRRCTASWASR